MTCLLYDGCRRGGPIDGVAQLGDGWCLEPKVDGLWALVDVGPDGRVVEITGRNGARPRCSFVADWLWSEVEDIVVGHRRRRGIQPVTRPVLHQMGAETGLPAGRYLTELEAGTERAEKARARHGCCRLHLRDVLQLGDRDLRGEPRWLRRALLEDAAARRSARLLLVEARRFARGEDAARWARELAAAGGEGVVAHRLDALFAEPGAALKFKAEDTADLEVLRVEARPSGTRVVVLGAIDPDTGRLVEAQRAALPRAARVTAGQVVEVRHNGRLASGALRHGRLGTARVGGASLVRLRDDKQRPDYIEIEQSMPLAEAATRLGASERTVQRRCRRLGHGVYHGGQVAGEARRRGRATPAPAPEVLDLTGVSPAVAEILCHEDPGAILPHCGSSLTAPFGCSRLGSGSATSTGGAAPASA